MATRQRDTEAKRDRIGPLSAEERKRVKAAQHRNAARRKLYADDPEYAERIKQRERAAYWSGRQKPASIRAEGLQVPAVRREVRRGEQEDIHYVDCYTIPECAEAFGMSWLGFRRWVKQGLIPPPILTDTVRGFSLYSRGELETIRIEVVRHERDFLYLSVKHTATIERIWRAVQRFRSNHI